MHKHNRPKLAIAVVLAIIGLVLIYLVASSL